LGTQETQRSDSKWPWITVGRNSILFADRVDRAGNACIAV